jgi:hypothetical protein
MIPNHSSGSSLAGQGAAAQAPDASIGCNFDDDFDF